MPGRDAERDAAALPGGSRTLRSGYTTVAGHTLIDSELYLPCSWTGDAARWGVGDEVYRAISIFGVHALTTRL